MPKIHYAFDLSGVYHEISHDFPIASATELDRGVAVQLSSNLVVAATLGTHVPLGITAQASEVGDTTVRVFCSPTAVFRAKPADVGVDLTTDDVGDIVDGIRIFKIDTIRNEIWFLLNTHTLAPIRAVV